MAGEIFMRVNEVAEELGVSVPYGVNDTDRLHFATAAGKIGNGLDEQLENFVREHPDTRLIIIDTMQKIREVGGEAYSYRDRTGASTAGIS